jgi:hypothetical protein
MGFNLFVSPISSFACDVHPFIRVKQERRIKPIMPIGKNDSASKYDSVRGSSVPPYPEGQRRRRF